MKKLVDDIIISGCGVTAEHRLYLATLLYMAKRV